MDTTGVYVFVGAAFFTALLASLRVVYVSLVALKVMFPRISAHLAAEARRRHSERRRLLGRGEALPAELRSLGYIHDAYDIIRPERLLLNGLKHPFSFTARSLIEAPNRALWDRIVASAQGHMDDEQEPGS